MLEKKLTLEQNICAAKIFLNTFGFKLEDVRNLTESSKIKIFNKSMNEVGELHFNNQKVVITAKYNKITLTASYDFAKMFGFVDVGYDNELFGQWFSKINFKIDNSVDSIKGEFLVTNTADSEFGISCQCHPLITLNIPNQGDFVFKILRDGSIFYFEFNTKNYSELIEISSNFECIRHVIKKGEFDREKNKYVYKKDVGIFNASEDGIDKDKLHVFLNEEQNGRTLAYQSKLVKKIDKNNYRKTNIQCGLLMQKFDNNMLKKVQLLREILTIDDISLLDNLISVCYDNYTDEELVALLGIKRPAFVYQDGAENLTDSYFGIGKESMFLLPNEQKQLLKKQEV